jgi:hypothetical protein
MTARWDRSLTQLTAIFLSPDRIELRVITDATGQRVTNGTVLVWNRVP